MEEEGGGIKVDGVIHRYLVEKKKEKNAWRKVAVITRSRRNIHRKERRRSRGIGGNFFLLATVTSPLRNMNVLFTERSSNNSYN